MYFLFIDAISTILGLGIHPGRLKSPHARWLAMTNFNLFKIGQLVNQTKESIYLYIDQKLQPNMADLLTKFNIHKDQPKL